MMTASPPLSFDLLIVGGGLTGAALALALSEGPAPLHIGLLDATASNSNNSSNSEAMPSFDERVLALSEGSRRLLVQLGVWDALAVDACAIASIHISDRGQFGRTLLSAAEQQVAALGQVIPLRVMGQALYRALATRATVTRLQGRASALGQHADGIELTLDSATTLKARAVLAADGGPSSLRALAALPVDTDDYQQSALIATVRTDRSHDHCAYERFTNTGPLALLPMTDNRLSLVWTLAPADASRLLTLDDAEFLRELQHAFGWRLGRFVQVGAREMHDLKRQQSPVRRQGRLLLMGNASLTVHPIAGQGFNLALRDAMAFVTQARAVLANGVDPFTPSALQDFVATREADRRHVSGVTDSLVHLFSNDYPLLRQTRAAALSALVLLPPIKRYVARHAMGLAPR